MDYPGQGGVYVKEGGMKEHRIKRGRHLPKAVWWFGAMGLVFLLLGCGKFGREPTIKKEPLPYETDALKPYISEKTMRVHYGKHYIGYVDKANRLLSGSDFEGKPAQEIIRLTSGIKAYAAIFNNVAQAVNHAFFWKCLKPGGGPVNAEVADRIVKSFGSFENFKQQFLKAAINRFGSGWAWLVIDGGKLRIVTTADADTPAAHGMKPIFAVDVWEHAYYLDYQNRRAEYVQNILNHLINWDFIASRLTSPDM